MEILTPKHEHDLWVAAFTAALSESAIKLIDSPGTPATGGDRVGLLMGKAAEIANLAQELYKEIWGVSENFTLSPGDRATVIRGLRAGLARCSAIADLTVRQNTRVRLARALRVFGATVDLVDTDKEETETEIPLAKDAQIRHVSEISGPVLRAQRQLLSRLLRAEGRQTSTGPYCDKDLLHGLIRLTDEIAKRAHDDFGVDCLIDCLDCQADCPADDTDKE